MPVTTKQIWNTLFPTVKADSNINAIVSWEERFSHYFMTFMELALNRFVYEGMPDTIDRRFVEFSLCRDANVFVFEDPILGVLSLTGAYSGLDMYRNPVDYQVITPTGYSPFLPVSEGVIVWNNFMRVPDVHTIEMFARDISDIYQSALVNFRAQKHPVVVVAENEAEKITLKNAYAKLDGNSPVIYTRKNLNLANKFETIDTKAPFVAPDMLNAARNIIEEFMQWLGVSLPVRLNRDHVATDEQNAQNQVSYILRERGLQSRQIGWDKVNRKFGLNVKVRFNEQLNSLVAETLGRDTGIELFRNISSNTSNEKKGGDTE